MSEDKTDFKASMIPPMYTFLACIAYLATSPLTRSILINFPHATQLPFFIGAEMLALIATTLVIALLPQTQVAETPSIIIGASLLNVLGALVFVCNAFFEVPWFILVLSGCACGIATVPLVNFFAQSLSRKTLGENVILTAGVVGIATILFWLVSLFPLIPRSVLWVLLLLIAAGSTILIVNARKKNEVSPKRVTIAAPKPISQQFAVSRKQELSTIASLLAVPLIGTFTFGLYIKAGVIPNGERPLLFGIDEELTLFIVAAVILAVIGAVRPHRPLYASLYQVVVPAFACVILVIISFPNGSFMHSLGGLFIVFSMAFILLFTLAAAATLIGSGEIPPLFITSIVLSVYAAGRVAGMIFHNMVGAGLEAYIPYQIVITVLLSIMLLVIAVQGRKRSTGTSLDGPQTIAEKIDSTCSYLTKSYNLSPRETEVLNLLARGYSPVYVAEKLVISENTARTHANRIYRKLNINTREELLTLVDEVENTHNR